MERLSQPKEGSQPLHFGSRFSRSIWEQVLFILWKNNKSYWRFPQYNAVRMVFTVIFGLIIGAIYWRLGKQR